MNIQIRRSGRKWIAEVWSDDQTEYLVEEGYLEPYPEEVYVEMNDWCKETLGYHARTAYHIFELKKEQDLTFFVLRWN